MKRYKKWIQLRSSQKSSFISLSIWLEISFSERGLNDWVAWAGYFFVQEDVVPAFL